MINIRNITSGPARVAAPASDRLYGPARYLGLARVFGPASDRLLGPARLA